MGDGWALATAFDFIEAVEQAEFWVPEVELGVAFSGGPALVMAARLGPWRAKEAMILCRHFTARQLYELGIVNQVVKEGDLMPAVLQWKPRPQVHSRRRSQNCDICTGIRGTEAG